MTFCFEKENQSKTSLFLKIGQSKSGAVDFG